MKAQAPITRYEAGDRSFVRVNLQGAELRQANLFGATLWEANLEGADLSGANLQRAQVARQQLNQAKSPEGAVLPDGTAYTRKAPAEEEQAETSKPEPVPSEPEPQGTNRQPDQPGDLEAGKVYHA